MTQNQKKGIQLAGKLKPTVAWRDRQILATDLEEAKTWINYAWESHERGKRGACLADLLDARPHLKSLLDLLSRLSNETPKTDPQ